MHLEGLHPVRVRALLHQLLQRRVASGPLDRLAHRAGRDEHLRREHEAGAVLPRQEALRDDALERVADALAQLVGRARLALRREREHAADGARDVGRVERREHEVAGLGGLERDVHRQLVADLADEDDVGILAERGAERVGEGAGVDADLALADARLVVVVEELDRVLDRDDVERLRPVQVPDHRGERRALAVAGGADDEDEAAIRLGERLRTRRERRAPRRSGSSIGIDAHDDRERSALAVDVDAEAADARAPRTRVVLAERRERSRELAARG